MAVKTVIEVDVNSQEFDKFASVFGKFNDALKGQTETWKKINQGIDATTKFAEKNKKTQFEVNEVVAKQYLSQKKINEATKEQAETLETIKNVQNEIKDSVSATGKNIESMASTATLGRFLILLEVAKKIGQTAIGVATGASFGLAQTASQFNNERNKNFSQGIKDPDISGVLRASYANYGINIDSAFERIALAKTDPNLQLPFALNNISTNQSTEAIFSQSVNSFLRDYRDNPQIALKNYESLGFNNSFAQTMINMPEQERRDMLSGMANGKPTRPQVTDQNLTDIASMSRSYSTLANTMDVQKMKGMAFAQPMLQGITDTTTSAISGDYFKKFGNFITESSDDLKNFSEKLKESTAVLGGVISKSSTQSNAISRSPEEEYANEKIVGRFTAPKDKITFGQAYDRFKRKFNAHYSNENAQNEVSFGSTIDRAINKSIDHFSGKDGVMNNNGMLLNDIIPNGRITSRFGENRDGRIHLGTDLANGKNSPISAFRSGNVKNIGYDETRGNFIEFDVGKGITSSYLNQHQIQ